ncbi:uncharacterized protein LOC120120277 [Hibiscus syriacus]|uniref:uncharacterized protein LOC120120277 n=1 Tax=Hibiscus syriacus TaxID=106335 RepID=UPI00192320AF|nr:uncharacterized protein LOC120120277 [Hibiscus syriacus]
MELLEGYEKKIKRTIWVVLKEVPLIVWSNKFFNDLGSLWGSVVSIHEDTYNRTRFDEARVLMEVQYASSVPEKCILIINGTAYTIIFFTEDHEEEKVFIDGFPTGGVVGKLVADDDGMFPRLQEECDGVADIDVGYNDDRFYEVQSQRSENRGISGRSMHADLCVGNMEETFVGLHEVPVVSIDGPINQMVDESIGLVEINRETTQCGTTHSISNSSRLIDVSVEEISSWQGLVVENMENVYVLQKEKIPSFVEGVPVSAVGNFDIGVKDSYMHPGCQALIRDNSRKLKKMVKGCVGRYVSARAQKGGVLFSEDNFVQPLGNEMEAEVVLAVADTLGVQFGGSRKRVIERGVGKREKVRVVCPVAESNKVSMMLIQETKVMSLHATVERRLKGRIGRELVYAPAEGASGGLVSMWDGNFFNVSCQRVYKRFIVLKGRIVQHNLEISIINVYGPNVYGDRVCFFDQLSSIIDEGACDCGGDFNIVRSDVERTEVQDISNSMLIFEEFISKWELVEVPSLGSVFTWFRGGACTAINELDRFLISADIACLSTNLVQATLHISLSDHNPVLLYEKEIKKACRPFKWFNHWADDHTLAEKIKRVFHANRGKDMNSVLLLVKNVTKDWAKVSRELNSEPIEVLEKKIVILEKSRLKWFREGDKNTRFFHLTTAMRGRMNQISKLKMNNSVFKS